MNPYHPPSVDIKPEPRLQWFGLNWWELVIVLAWLMVLGMIVLMVFDQSIQHFGWE